MKKERRFEAPYLRGNLGLKLFALFIAILLWFHATTEKVYLTQRTIPVSYGRLPDSLFILNSLPKAFKIEVRGKGKELLVFSLLKPKAKIDLSGLKPGKRSLRITPALLALPQNAEFSVEGISPEEIELIVDKLASRRVKVEVVTEGAPPEGFALIRTEVQGMVQLLGPSEIIRDYGAVKTEPLSLTRKRQDFQVEAKLIPPHEMTRTEPDKVQVKLFLEAEEVRTFEGIPFKIIGLPPEKVRLRPPRVKVVLSLPSSLLHQFTKDSIQARLELWGLEPGEYRLAPSFSFPKGVHLLQSEPKEVVVVVKK